MCIPQGVPICKAAVCVLPALAKHHLLPVPERWWDIIRLAALNEVCVCKPPVVGCTDTLRTNKAFRNFYFHTGTINDTKKERKEANTLSRLSAAKHLFVSVGANVSFE